MAKNQKKPRPAQIQLKQPGIESRMRPHPQFIDPGYQGSNKLKNKVAIITGGDSGIGRAVAIAFAMEGADIAITYLNEHNDAKLTQQMIETIGRRCIRISGDIGKVKFCQLAIKKILKEFNKVDILVNNSAVQFPHKNFSDISFKQLEYTFRTNIFSYFFMTQAVLPHLKKGSTIINTASITAYRGHAELIDYSSTKGAIVALTRSLSQQLIKKGIRVNGVAPGPIWTPLIPASFSAKKVKKFGENAPMERAGEPKEVAPCYVFLASKDSAYMSGQVLHPNGGEVING